MVQYYHLIETQPIRSVQKRDGGIHSVNTLHAGNTWSSMTSWSQLKTTITPVMLIVNFILLACCTCTTRITGCLAITYTHGGK